jgi:protein phosphatase PTC2/3
MEDAHAAVLDLQTAAENGAAAQPTTRVEDRLSFFGVYDGHGGDRVAQFAGENIHHIIAKQEAFKKGDIEQALKDGFLATDRAILAGQHARNNTGGWRTDSCFVDPRYEEEVSGCTASVGILSATKIYVVCCVPMT